MITTMYYKNCMQFILVWELSNVSNITFYNVESNYVTFMVFISPNSFIYQVYKVKTRLILYLYYF